MSRDESKSEDLSPEQMAALERLVRARTDGVFVTRPHRRKGVVQRRTLQALVDLGYLLQVQYARWKLTEKAFAVARRRWWVEEPKT